METGVFPKEPVSAGLNARALLSCAMARVRANSSARKSRFGPYRTKVRAASTLWCGTSEKPGEKPQVRGGHGCQSRLRNGSNPFVLASFMQPGLCDRINAV